MRHKGNTASIRELQRIIDLLTSLDRSVPTRLRWSPLRAPASDRLPATPHSSLETTIDRRPGRA